MNYFHGGPPHLSIGESILPASETGVKSASDYGAEHVHRRDRIYLTTNPTAAKLFAALHPSGKGEVYRVDPVGAVDPDPDCSEDGLSYQCERAVIVGKIPFPKHERRMCLKAGLSA